MPATESRCAACGSDALVPHLSVAGPVGDAGLIPTTDRFGSALADIVRCTGCGHRQLERFPPRSELAEAYEEATSLDYVGEEAGQRATAARILARLESRTRGRRLVDLGCWVGFLLSEAERRGWSTTGVEPSEFASAYARETLGLDVRTTDLFEAGLEPASFDAVVMADVLEHLIDPGAALDEVRSLLAPGGVLALVLPDAGSSLARAMGPRWWSVLPTHVQYFTRASLSTLLERHGFAVLELDTAPKAFTVDYYLERIAGYSPRASAWLRSAACRVGLSERIWAPDFRDRMRVLGAVQT